MYCKPRKSFTEIRFTEWEESHFSKVPPSVRSHEHIYDNFETDKCSIFQVKTEDIEFQKCENLTRNSAEKSGGYSGGNNFSKYDENFLLIRIENCGSDTVHNSRNYFQQDDKTDHAKAECGSTHFAGNHTPISKSERRPSNDNNYYDNTSYEKENGNDVTCQCTSQSWWENGLEGKAAIGNHEISPKREPISFVHVEDADSSQLNKSWQNAAFLTSNYNRGQNKHKFENTTGSELESKVQQNAVVPKMKIFPIYDKYFIKSKPYAYKKSGKGRNKNGNNFVRNHVRFHPVLHHNITKTKPLWEIKYDNKNFIKSQINNHKNLHTKVKSPKRLWEIEYNNKKYIRSQINVCYVPLEESMERDKVRYSRVPHPISHEFLSGKEVEVQLPHKEEPLAYDEDLHSGGKRLGEFTYEKEEAKLPPHGSHEEGVYLLRRDSSEGMPKDSPSSWVKERDNSDFEKFMSNLDQHSTDHWCESSERDLKPSHVIEANAADEREKNSFDTLEGLVPIAVENHDEADDEPSMMKSEFVFSLKPKTASTVQDTFSNLHTETSETFQDSVKHQEFEKDIEN